MFGFALAGYCASTLRSRRTVALPSPDRATFLPVANGAVDISLPEVRVRVARDAAESCGLVEAVGEHAAGRIGDEDLLAIERAAIPGTGSCGGMYTANTMSSAFEVMGLSLPYSSTMAAEDPEKAESAGHGLAAAAVICLVIAVVCTAAVWSYDSRGKGRMAFDWFLKGIVGLIVVWLTIVGGIVVSRLIHGRIQKNRASASSRTRA